MNNFNATSSAWLLVGQETLLGKNLKCYQFSPHFQHRLLTRLSVQASGEVVQVTYGFGTDGLIKIGRARVVTNPSIKYDALKILSAAIK